MAKCGFTSCKNRGVHRHHIIYKPPVICPLCLEHHEAITILNGMKAREGGFAKLSDLQRWQIWVQWLEKRLIAEWTKENMEYVKKWAKENEQFTSNSDIRLADDLDFDDLLEWLDKPLGAKD